MAKYRAIQTEFWQDSRVIEEMTPEDKFFFLYILTNPLTKQIGIYEITKKQMAFDMGYSIETINSLLQRFVEVHKLIKYNHETRELAIKNWGKHNFTKGGKPIEDCVNSELKEVQDVTLISYVSEYITKPNIKELYDCYLDAFDDTYTIRENISTTRTQKEKEKKRKRKRKRKRDRDKRRAGGSG